MEHRQARSDLLREGEQVHLLAELAVVALGGLLHARLVGLELILRRERHAVDALQHRVRLGALPVCGGCAFKLERLDEARVRQVRSAAQVGPHDVAVAVDVVVHAQLFVADLDGRLGVERVLLVLDELELVRLVGLLLHRLLLGDDTAGEALRGLDDALHVLLDRLEVVGRERFGHVEVVVEAVLDDRADAELGVGTDLLHRLRHDVRRRMTHDRDAVLGVEGDRFDDVAVLERRVEVARFAVEAYGDDVLVVGEQFDARLACIHLLRFAVDRDGDGVLCHGCRPCLSGSAVRGADLDC